MTPGPNAPELHRPVPLDRIGSVGLLVAVDATAAECAAIAVRLQVPAVRRLHCRFELSHGQSGRVTAAGMLNAVVERSCVLSLDEFDAAYSESFTVLFVPYAAGPEDDEIDPADLDAPDEIAYAGNIIDVGEAAVEQLALTLDPYPRKPGAELPGEAEAAAASPFASLARWSRGE